MTLGKLFNFSDTQCLPLCNRANNSPYSCQSWASCPISPPCTPAFCVTPTGCLAHAPMSVGLSLWEVGGRKVPGYFSLSLCLGERLWEQLPLLLEGPQLWIQLPQTTEQP